MNVVTLGAIKYHYRQLHKFGGSSLSDIKSYKQVANIMAKYSHPGDLIVVSAAGTTTNQLINWLKLSQTDRILANQARQALLYYQQNLIVGLLPGGIAKILKLAFLAELDYLSTLLDKPIQNNIYAEIVGHGEIWSARLMSAVLEEFGLPSHWLDARLFLRAEFAAQPQVDETISRLLLQHFLQQHPNKRLVVTGFIAQSKQGKTVLLGRNGSDYSATQVGVLAEVKKITIWSDVAGVYSADPCKVKNACLLPLLCLDEASELARLAAPVLHTRTLQPISFTNIDLQLKCSYQPEHGSTKIERVLKSSTGVTIVTSHDDVCLVELKLARNQNLNQAYKEIDLLLKLRQLRPLAIGLHTDRKLIQLCYTSEVAANALAVLKEIAVVEDVLLRNQFSLVALVGAGVGKNPLHSHLFYEQLKEQPLEFIWHSEEGISLVAVLRGTQTLLLVQELHQSLLLAENHIDLLLLNKSKISYRWLKLFAAEQKKICL